MDLSLAVTPRWCLIGLLAAGFLAPPIFAQDADPEARAEAIVDRFLTNLQTSTSELTLEIDEDYELDQDGDTFNTVFDPVVLSDEEMSFDVGPLSISITPGDEELSEVEFSIGDEVVIYEGDAEVARISIGEQSAEGIWDDELEAFASSSVQMVKLSLEVPDNPFQAELAGLDFNSELVMDDDQTWTSRASIQASALAIQGPEGQAVELGMLRAEGNISGSDYERFASFSAELQEMFSPEKLESMDGDPQATQNFISTLTELYGFFHGFEGSVTLSDFAVSQGDTPLGAFDSLALGADFSAADDGSSMGYSLELQGLATPMAPVPPNLLPDAVRFEVGLNNIPAGLVEKISELAVSTEGMSADEQQAMMSQELLGMVMQSELGAYIRETYISAPDTRIDLSLEAQVSPQSPFGAVGDLDLQIVGLDVAVQGAGLAQNPDIAPALAMITAFSNRSEDNGKVVDSFALQVTADGKLMLNGKDISGMLMGAGAAPPPPPAADEESAEAAPTTE